ncbi:MAG: formate--tetrahydrofolate ligase [Thermaerobacter sp.]|nr:formate--tetrahydrofolate ligase [Thermaerobacter sp.]
MTEHAGGDRMLPVTTIAEQLSLTPGDILGYGRYKAKIPLEVLYSQPRKAKLVLVTSINPTPLGEGKTTMSIGLAQALSRRGWLATAVLREPSLGPTFGMKGGATGGGQAQVEPAQEINLHFTGDFHAITTAHNLLAALLDNALYFRTGANLSAHRISWKRVLDLNDRALRHIVIGLGGAGQGIPRETGFDITAASEVMAVLTLARDREDLVARLGRIVVGTDSGQAPVTVADIGAAPAMAVLLNEAIMPNLVQTSEHTPAIIHGGPFANIAHGCNSVLATEAGLRHSEVVVTEAGFGADLGAEKFLDIKAPLMGISPDVAVVVVTLRALKYQGGRPAAAASEPDLAALASGYANLQKHIENLRRFALPVIVGINRFAGDRPEEMRWIHQKLEADGVGVEEADVFVKGGEGGVGLARLVESVLRSGRTPTFQPLYRPEMSLTAKIQQIARGIYGAQDVEYTAEAQRKLERYATWGDGQLGVCIAKTPYSLSDDPRRLGRPEGFTLNIRDVELARGAGYIVPLAGTMVRMPGLPKTPAAFGMHVTPDGRIEGIR